MHSGKRPKDGKWVIANENYIEDVRLPLRLYATTARGKLDVSLRAIAQHWRDKNMTHSSKLKVSITTFG